MWKRFLAVNQEESGQEPGAIFQAVVTMQSLLLDTFLVPPDARPQSIKLAPTIRLQRAAWAIDATVGARVYEAVDGYIFLLQCDPVWPSGKQRDLGSNPLRLSFHFKGCGLWTLSCDFVPHNYERLKWLSSLPTLMQKSFWWWQCNVRYIISVSPHLHIPFPPSPRP